MDDKTQSTGSQKKRDAKLASGFSLRGKTYFDSIGRKRGKGKLTSYIFFSSLQHELSVAWPRPISQVTRQTGQSDAAAALLKQKLSQKLAEKTISNEGRIKVVERLFAASP